MGFLLFMLTAEERDLLETYAGQNTSDAPYWDRVQIVLATDDGATPEEIAPRLGLSMNRVRLWQRVFRKQRLEAFPDHLFLPPPLFSPDDTMAEAGRCLLLEMLNKMERYWPAAALHADPTAVHEVRKTIRQTFTIYRQFAPYFVQGTLADFRRRWKRVMRRLGQARDLTIFQANLNHYLAQSDLTPKERATLRQWQGKVEKELAAANRTLIHDLNQDKVHHLRDRYRQFLEAPGDALIPSAADQFRVRFEAPQLILQKWHAVRRDKPFVTGGTLAELHQLRIDFKELRYTIRFFEPLLGLRLIHCLGVLERIQDHLGWLNDSRVALELLARPDQSEQAETALYQAVLQDQAESLRLAFPALWEQFDSLAWRQNLHLALARL